MKRNSFLIAFFCIIILFIIILFVYIGNYEEPNSAEVLNKYQDLEFSFDIPIGDMKTKFQNQVYDDITLALKHRSYLGQFLLTAYCSCPICCDEYAYHRPLDANGNPIVYTATGTVAKEGYTIAVDPKVIPYGTEVIINGHIYRAEDCGGAINNHHIDVYFENHQDALNFAMGYYDVYLNYTIDKPI